MNEQDFEVVWAGEDGPVRVVVSAVGVWHALHLAWPSMPVSCSYVVVGPLALVRRVRVSFRIVEG